MNVLLSYMLGCMNVNKCYMNLLSNKTIIQKHTQVNAVNFYIKFNRRTKYKELNVNFKPFCPGFNGKVYFLIKCAIDSI